MKKIIWINILAVLVLSACKNDEYLYRDISSRIWLGVRDTVGNVSFRRDSTESSLMLMPASVEKDTLYVTANVTGATAPVDRKFRLEVVPEKTNVTPADYILGEAIIPANSFRGDVPVIVSKNIPGLDLKKEKARLVFRFVPNEHFLYAPPGLDTFKLAWFNFIPQPASWSGVQSYLGVFTQAKYKFILDYFGGQVNLERYRGNTNLLLGLQSALRKALRDYNENPANQGRPEGWPYLNDDGTPLTF